MDNTDGDGRIQAICILAVDILYLFVQVTYQQRVLAVYSHMVNNYVKNVVYDALYALK